MKAATLEKALLLIVAFAALIVWTSSRYLAAAPLDSPLADINHQNKNPNSGRTSTIDNPQTDDGPLFVLHIGPPKTATTTIQCGLHHLSHTLATKDSYYYVGKTCPQYGSNMENNETAVAGHHLLMGLNGGNPNTRGYIGLKERMDYHLAQGHSMIYSNEGFAHHLEDKNISWQCLQSLFHGWNVRIVIGYRHYFEWIRSLYYQQFLNAKKYKQNWPGQNKKGLAHPSFLWYLDYHLHRFETGDLSVDGGNHAPAYGHHLSLSTYKKFRSYFQDIQFFDLYEEGDLVTNFVCDVLPNAKHSCRTLQSHQTMTTINDGVSGNVTHPAKAHGLVKRISKSFDAQRIAEAAYQQGLIRKTSRKPTVVARIEEKLEEMQLDSNPNFLSCPSLSLEERFWNASVTFEQEMLAISHPDWSNEKRDHVRKEHRAMFDVSKAEAKFCEIDPQTVLQDKDWVDFLSIVE